MAITSLVVLECCLKQHRFSLSSPTISHHFSHTSTARVCSVTDCDLDFSWALKNSWQSGGCGCVYTYGDTVFDGWFPVLSLATPKAGVGHAGAGTHTSLYPRHRFTWGWTAGTHSKRFPKGLCRNSDAIGATVYCFTLFSNRGIKVGLVLVGSTGRVNDLLDSGKQEFFSY